MDWIGKRCGHGHSFQKKYQNNYNVAGFAQLVGIDMSTGTFQSIIKDFDDLRTNHLDVGEVAGAQRAKLRDIGHELVKRHPGVFKEEHGDEHLYFALHIIMQHHSVDRCMIKNGNGRKIGYEVRKYRKRVLDFCGQTAVTSREIQCHNTIEKATVPPRVVSGCGLQSTPNKTIPVRPQCGKSTSPSIDSPLDVHITITPNLGSTVEVFQHPLHPVDDVHPMAVSSTTSHRRELSLGSTHCSSEFNAPRYRPPLNPSDNVESSAEEDAPDMQQMEISSFLSTCQPPMIQYLRCFTDFGCMTSTHLRSVSLWGSEHRHNLINKILRSGLTKAPPAMDIAILEHQFQTYFKVEE